LALTGEYRGMIITGRDQSLLQVERLTALRERWLDGAPLLLDSAAAAIAGAHYSAHAPTPEEGEAAEKAAQRSFLEGRTVISAGLALLPVAVEPDVVANNRWGRLFSLAYVHPAAPAFGLGQGAALVIRPDGAEVVGDEVVVSLDLRPATLAWGANRAFVIANGLLDVFAPGDTVAYVDARQQGP
jgi:cyanophycinase-like exopeptidase